MVNSEIQKLKNEYPEFFEKFSSELLEFLFSEEIASQIAEICFENEITNPEKIEKIAYQIGLILLDQVPEENFTEILENKVPLKREIAEKLSLEFKRVIFSQIPGKKIKKKLPKEEKPFTTLAELLFSD